jgi:catechol 2,3-dioxygenase-like lactoylglutathione lyase family enzyme
MMGSAGRISGGARVTGHRLAERIEYRLSLLLTRSGRSEPGRRAHRPPSRPEQPSSSTVKLLTIDHVQLAMPTGGEARAVAFFSGVLGMEPIPKPEPMRPTGGVWFRSGAVELHLGVEPDFRPARKAHPALLVDDIDAFAARCEAAGWPITWDDRYPGVRRFYVADPFGNRIELMQFIQHPDAEVRT